MFLVNSRLGLFSVSGSLRIPFSLSYGVILPSSLTTLLPLAYGYSPHLPVSDCGTGAYKTIAAFLDSMGEGASLLLFAPRRALVYEAVDLPAARPLRLARYFRFPGSLSLLCPHSSECMRYRNFYLLSIGYGFRPRLRSRLTLSRLALLRKP